MAPTALAEDLTKRFVGCGSGWYWTGAGCRRSGWYSWGRWVVAGVIIFLFLLFLVAMACVNSRRRRVRGQHPRYGTGWMAPNDKYQNNASAYQPPPPQYSAASGYNAQQPQYTGQTFNSNEGYYGGHNEGVAAPQNTYYPTGARGGDNVYEPPLGPPPGK